MNFDNPLEVGGRRKDRVKTPTQISEAKLEVKEGLLEDHGPAAIDLAGRAGWRFLGG